MTVCSVQFISSLFSFWGIKQNVYVVVNEATWR